ncbi:MAG: hypothetical protein M3N19_03775 [Candidatus Eremiobacteraeota bacterium]|nr:hypothetical protein [Candidatus Eremiobacteraeota bacterium]
MPVYARCTLRALFFALGTILAIQGAALASTLDTLSVSAVRGGGARVLLSISGGVPAAYHVTGGGTTSLTLILPNTTIGSRLNQVSFPGPQNSALFGVTLSAVGPEVDIGINLSTATPVTARASGNVLQIDVEAPKGGPIGQTPGQNSPGGAVPNSGATQLNPNRLFEVIPLKYADVSEVVGVLVEGQTIAPNDTFAASGSIFGLPQSTNGAVQAAQQPIFNQQNQPQSFGQKINENLAIDRRLNAVIVSGTQAEIDSLKVMINKIDVPLPSVVLECQVLELSENAAHDLGIDFNNAGQLASASLTAGSAVPSLTNTTPAGPLTSLAFNAKVFAAISHGGGRILATPRILALNGNLASILSGDALPIITTTTIPGSPPVYQQTVNYIAVGVNLQIQPRITSDGFVTSHLFAEVSSVTAFVPTNQGEVPQISLRQATTQATVKDGQPFVIGGLLRDEEISNMSRIPVLGNLPLLGGFFRVRHDTNTRTNLFIIVTPRIVHQLGMPEPGSIPAGLPTPRVPGPTPVPATPQP